jgi:predicted Fe-Mo cluster-binding NifX family protein
MKEEMSMKIAIPTNGPGGLADELSDHIGMAPTYTIVESETGDVEVMPNTGPHHGGFEPPPVTLGNAGVDLVLCCGLPGHALGLFNRLGVEVLVGAEGTAQDALDQWKAGKLSESTGDDDSDHGCGHH